MTTLRCRLGIHRWSRWSAHSHYIDTSWGDHAESTDLVRRCNRCGLVGSKALYGVALPLEEPS